MRKIYKRNIKRGSRKRFKKNLRSGTHEQSQEGKWRRKEIMYSLIAVILSITTFIWSVYQDFKKDKEEVIINSFTPVTNTSISFRNFSSYKLITLEFGILLSNTGDNTISLINYDLQQVAKSQTEKGTIYPVSYSGMNQGFIGTDGQTADIPFIIKSGESKLIYIKTGILVAKDIYVKFNNAYKDKTGKDLASVQDFTYEDLMYYSAKTGVDIYGNKIEGKIYDDSSEEKIFFLSVDEDAFHPVFSLTFKSAKGNSFNHIYGELMTASSNSLSTN
ncbi:hypothetical protein COM81_27820 [Priestia megaterium]|uniref:hypothetical protein n=1 Tax=Priestia megaterium TaxID=1404 RepID=UPI000BEDA763|nr:hypothetical protein [Priestia megaterium]PEE73600.1 hypothetical protein COM81_27820 [Priestia megaterium]